MEAVGNLSVKEAAMHYIQHMSRILKLDGDVFKALAATHLPMRYCMINVTLVGLIYGTASVHFANVILGGRAGAEGSFNLLMLLLVGISLAFIMHGGLALFVWVFCRGIGGNPYFLPVYLFIGTAAIALWPLAPAVSALQTGVAGMGVTAYAAVAASYGAAVILVAVKAASGLSWAKMSLAAAATVVYVGCFLYLWM
jgi:hypothetical protein